MTLALLLDRAMIKTYDRWTWFGDVCLVGDSLMVTDARRADTIRRCFLAKLQEFYPGLTVTVVSVEKAPQKAHAPRRSVFKGGYEPQPFAPDLLSSQGDE